MRIEPEDGATAIFSEVDRAEHHQVTVQQISDIFRIIAYEHLSAKAILSFLHRWQMNLHEQSWLRTFHTTKEILFVKRSDGDDELVSQLRDG